MNQNQTCSWSAFGISLVLLIFLVGEASADTFTMVSPNGGENWTRGTNETIKWTSSGNPGANVKIDLLKGGVLNRVINSSTPNNGTYTWTIPATQTPGTDYKIRVTNTTNPSYTDTSNNNFAISTGTSISSGTNITVNSPNGGENWTRSTTNTITWTSSGNPGAYVKIELLKAGVLNKVITSSTANNGSYSWTIPSTQTPGSDYKVRITSTTNSVYTDTSNNNFAISTGITVVSPGNRIVSSGNRVWDENKNMSTDYTWNAYSFSGFYYNLDENQSTEEITIHNINPGTRVILQGDIDYTTSPIENSFVYPSFGSYQVIGFMAEKYFAGYTANSKISGNQKISTVASGQLHRVLLDNEDERVVNEGGTLTLNEGYVFKAKEVDIGGGPRQIWVSLLKDGNEVDSSVVAAGNTYIYTKTVGSVSDLPIIAVHVNYVFQGTEVNAAFIKGIFQISDSFTTVNGGDNYGIMQITGAGANQITMDNRDSVSLSPGNKPDLMGNLKIMVADNNSVLRFALSVEITGTFDVRGTIYPVTNEWTPRNFGLNIGSMSTGFFYDMDKDIGTENLKVSPRGTYIPEGGLVYSTSPQEISFDYPGFGSYQVIGFMAEKYFSGYTANTNPPNPTTMSKISTLARGQLHKVLIDDETQHVISIGSTLALSEGYVLKAKDIDLNARTMLLSLLKDGNEVDSSPLSADQTYVYMKTVGGVSDVPLIFARFDNVFSGTEMQAAFIKGLFQISENVTSVKNGDSYGQMIISSIDSGGIKMDNPNSIGLSPASTVDLMGNIKFKVADSGEVRFYPYVKVVPEMLANQLIIDAPAKANAGDPIKIMVTAGGAAIEGASVAIDSNIGQTDITGTLKYTLPKTLTGTYNLTATKLGYQKATKTIDVAEFVDKRLFIDAPARANQFESITIKTIFNGTPVSGATIAYDNMSIGQTDSSGALNYTLATGGTHTIFASKTDYITVARDIDVRLPFSDFKSLDINIKPPAVSTGGMAVIGSNITNAGTKKDTLPIVLIVNGTEMDNRSVTLAPGEVKMVNFTYKVTLPEGNYSVAILEQKASLEVVKKMPANGVLIGTGVIVIACLMLKRRENKKL